MGTKTIHFEKKVYNDIFIQNLKRFFEFHWFFCFFLVGLVVKVNMISVYFERLFSITLNLLANNLLVYFICQCYQNISFKPSVNTIAFCQAKTRNSSYILSACFLDFRSLFYSEFPFIYFSCWLHSFFFLIFPFVFAINEKNTYSNSIFRLPFSLFSCRLLTLLYS